MSKLGAGAAAACLSAALAIAGHPPRASAADIDQWSLCMGGAGAERALQACSGIIDSKREQPESLPYAYVYRGRGDLR